MYMYMYVCMYVCSYLCMHFHHLKVSFFNQAHAARAWFLEIALVRTLVCVCVCVCVCVLMLMMISVDD